MPEISFRDDIPELVRGFFPIGLRSTPEILSLLAIFEGFIQAGDLSTRLNALVELKEWTELPSLSLAGQSNDRLAMLLELMQARPELREQFQQGIRGILASIHSVELFAEAGLHPREHFWTEAIRRTVGTLLPPPRDDTDLSGLVARLFPTYASIDRMVKRSDAEFEKIVRLLAPVDDESAWVRQREDLIRAFRLLAVHVAGIGLTPGLRERSHRCSIEESPFYRLQQASAELVEQAGAIPALLAWRNEIRACSVELDYIHQRMEDAGVSTELVFDIGTIDRAINRMEIIARVLFDSQPEQGIAAIKRLLDDVMHARRGDMSVRALFRENAALVARKIVERTGKAGEPYIANSKNEYRKIWAASLGGGLVTVITAAIKMRVVDAHFPPFVEWMAGGTNYAVSFLVLQYFHLALATKQPSVTAATFAGIVRTTSGKARLDKLTSFIRRITCSQFASAIGNLLSVCVGCVVFAQLWSFLFGKPYLTSRSAEHVYETLDPIASGTALFAILTGVILWISALAGGWFENFATFNRWPEAIAQHPIGRRIGQQRMKRLSKVVQANLSGWTTSIVLGYMLGFVPAFGAFLGIPLDVRHVTLSTGTLALAAASFGRDWLHRGWFAFTLFGIAVTFFLNLGVSFSIAASVAMQAYGVPRMDRMHLMGHVLKSFLRSPRRFIFPSKDDWD
jgi:site-specific recombinase